MADTITTGTDLSGRKYSRLYGQKFYNEGTERNPTNQSPSHFHQVVRFSAKLNLPSYHSCLLPILFTQIFIVVSIQQLSLVKGALNWLTQVKAGCRGI
jgi:hypothetical protein